MARARSHEEILNQAVYAVACIAKHYGAALNASGLSNVRELLNKVEWTCDSHWRCDVEERPHIDFYDVYLRLNPLELDFNEIEKQSITKEDYENSFDS